MNIVSKDRPRILKIVVHELGHYLAAREFGFKVNNISLAFQYPKGHAGSAELEPWRTGVQTINDVTDYLEARVIILYAGVIAESTDGNGNYNSDYALRQWLQEGGVHDHAKVKELIFTLRNINHPNTVEPIPMQSELDGIESKLFDRAISYVFENSKLIRAIANQLVANISAYNSQYIFLTEEINALITDFNNNIDLPAS